MNYRKRTDGNHKEISQIMRSLGWTVKSRHYVGGGVLDLLCYREGRIAEIEVKDGRNKLLPSQAEYIYHNDHAFVARCEADCIEITNNPQAAREKSLAEAKTIACGIV